jgi:acyl carrier protein
MVSKNSFLKAFHSIFDETPEDEILISTKYKQLDEWSSLIVMSLIVLFDDEYKTKLTAADIDKAKTVEDLYNLIK